MDNQLIQAKNELLNANIYVDYENIFELLKLYGVDPLVIDFFPVILDKFRNFYKLNVIECIVYCNFERKPFGGRLQSILQKLGLQTRHTASSGKNSGDLMLTVDALTALYKNPNLNVFVIVSSDRDMIPLLKAIKYENKFTYVLSTKSGFNPVVSGYADYHEYLEDLFHLTAEMLINPEEERLEVGIGEADLNPECIERAKEVVGLFYRSHVWRKFESEGDPVTLKGYLGIISKKIGRPVSQIEKELRVAHYLNLLTIYRDPYKGFCIKGGEGWVEAMRKK